MLCGGVLLVAAWGVYRLHLRSLRREFAAVLDERNRVAREMHDTLIQGCIGVSTLLEAAANAQTTSPALGSELLERARLEVRTAVDEARQAVWNLRRGASPGDRLIPAVLQLAHRIGLDAGIDVRVQTDGRPTALDESAERSLVLSIREALQNAIRHGAARHLLVHLTFDARHLRVDIVDDGRGFTLSEERNEADHHYGLVGMRERIERLGGEFHVTSVPGQGTTIGLRVPLDAAQPRRSVAPNFRRVTLARRSTSIAPQSNRSSGRATCALVLEANHVACSTSSGVRCAPGRDVAAESCG